MTRLSEALCDFLQCWWWRQRVEPAAFRTDDQTSIDLWKFRVIEKYIWSLTAIYHVPSLCFCFRFVVVCFATTLNTSWRQTLPSRGVATIPFTLLLDMALWISLVQKKKKGAHFMLCTSFCGALSELFSHCNVCLIMSDLKKIYNVDYNVYNLPRLKGINWLVAWMKTT